MTGFGQNLRREREMRGVSLDAMAESTKIGTRLLKALEDEQFDLLPGGIFNKGFVRAYAKYLGIDEDAAVASYVQAAGQQEAEVRLVAEQNVRWERSSGRDADTSERGGFPILPVLILVVVVAAGFGGWHVYQQRMSEKQAAQATEQTAPPQSQTPASAPETLTLPSSTQSQPSAAQPGPAPIPSTAPGQGQAQSTFAAGNKTAVPEAPSTQEAKPTATTPTQPTGTPFEVSIHTKDRAWVSIKIDGDIQTRGVLPPDETRRFHANQQVVLWTGNAAAVDVAYNGKPVPLEGGPNDVKVLVFTPNGVSAGTPPKPRSAATPQQPTGSTSPQAQP